MCGSLAEYLTQVGSSPLLYTTRVECLCVDNNHHLAGLMQDAWKSLSSNWPMPGWMNTPLLDASAKSCPKFPSYFPLLEPLQFSVSVSLERDSSLPQPGPLVEVKNGKETVHHSGLDCGLWSQMGLGSNPGLVTFKLCHRWINLPCFLLPQIPTLHNEHKY